LFATGIIITFLTLRKNEDLSLIFIFIVLIIVIFYMIRDIYVKNF